MPGGTFEAVAVVEVVEGASECSASLVLEKVSCVSRVSNSSSRAI